MDRDQMDAPARVPASVLSIRADVAASEYDRQRKLIAITLPARPT